MKGKRVTADTKLSPQEEHFCQLFASDREFFCNGTQSYIEAFDVKIYKGGKKPDTKGNWKTSEAVRVAAHDLLTKANITTRINDIYQSRGLNDNFVDKQLEKLITQDAEFPVKVKAISEYNKLKGRITERQSVTHSFVTEQMSDEELDRLIEQQSKFFKKQ